jgi:hypothetical protein
MINYDKAYQEGRESGFEDALRTLESMLDGLDTASRQEVEQLITMVREEEFGDGGPIAI